MPQASAFAGIPRVLRPRAAPTDDRVAFFWNPGERYDLFASDVSAGERRRLTDGEPHRSPNAPALWTRSGDALYFQTGEHGYSLGDIHRVDLEGEVERVATPGGGWGLLWGVDPTESWMLYTHRAAGETQRVYRHDVETGDRTQLSGPDTTVPSRGTRISPDGSRVCYPGNATPDPGAMDAYVVDADGGSPRRLRVPDVDEVRPQSWHPDGTHLLLYDGDEGRTGEFDFGTNETRWFGHGRPLAYLSPGTVVTREASLYDRETGERTGLPIGDGIGDELVADGVGLGGDRIVFARRSERRPAELYCYDRRSDQETRLVTADFGPVDPESVVVAEDVTYASGDDREVEALLYRPPDADDADPVPVVVAAHGFPGEAYRRFERKVQFFVSRGYAVLQPNFRGASNREEGFAASIRMDWGGAEQTDLAAAASWLSQQDWARSDRLALYGHSFGGFCVYTQLVRYPETWTVGIASGGITDLHALDASNDGDDLLREYMGHPRDDAALWRDRSPVTHVENIERPLFVLHGSIDTTTPVSQARAFRGALESVRGWTEGDEFEYEEIETGAHGNLDRETNARQWRLIVDFLDRRLGPGPDGGRGS